MKENLQIQLNTLLVAFIFNLRNQICRPFVNHTFKNSSNDDKLIRPFIILGDELLCVSILVCGQRRCGRRGVHIRNIRIRTGLRVLSEQLADLREDHGEQLADLSEDDGSARLHVWIVQ